MAGPAQRARRLKIAAAAVAAPLLLAVGAVLLLPRLLWSDGVDYSAVPSIERTTEYQDPALLERAWALPVAARYRPGLDYQRNASFCGPTSVVDVLRSLGQAAEQSMVLDGTDVRTVLGVVPGGLTLDELAALVARKTGRRATVLRDLTLAELRQHLTASNDGTRRYIVNLHRGPLFGRGGGHHSPLGGYLADRDLALVVDVNSRFRPWLVPAERLHRAIDIVDRQSGRKRGLVLIE